MKSKLVWGLGIGVLLVFSLVNCTGGTSALVGKWVSEDEDTVFEFFKNGSGILSEDGDDEKFTWTVAENRQLTFNFDGVIQSFDYKISGSVLTFTFDGYDGMVKMVFKRKK